MYISQNKGDLLLFEESPFGTDVITVGLTDKW